MTIHIDTLPPEILTAIFTHACTDGGPTGRALSLTSRGIHAAARPARFHTVALVCRPSQLYAFMALYTRERLRAASSSSSSSSVAAAGANPPTPTPVVAHLHLTIPPCVPVCHWRTGDPGPGRVTIAPWGTPQFGGLATAPPPPPSRAPCARLSLNAGLRAITRWTRRVACKATRIVSRTGSDSDDGNEDGDDEDVPAVEPAPLDPAPAQPDVDYHEAARALLRLLAPDLLTLALQPAETGLLLPNHLRFLDLPLPLPRVRELTLVALSDLHPLLVVPRAPSVDPADPADPDGAPLFPAVTHLHVGRRRLPGRAFVPMRVPSIWPADAPNVTHLRISCLPPPTEYSLPPPSAMDYMWAERAGTLVPPSPPPSGARVRYLVLQPGRELEDDVPTRCFVYRDGDGDDKSGGALELRPGQLQEVGPVESGAGETVRALVVEPYELDYRGWCARIREEWAERAGGGAGCWAELERALVETDADAE